MGRVPLVALLRETAESVYDLRFDSDKVAGLLRAAAIEIELWEDRYNALAGERRNKEAA